MSERRKSWSIPEDVKQEMREMREDGLYWNTIAWYFGVTIATVKSACDERSFRMSARRYYYRTRQRKIAQMKEYYRKNRDRLRQEGRDYQRRKRQEKI